MSPGYICLPERWRVTLLELDLDRFKWINDTLGHPGGDTILRAVAAALSATLRGSDTAYRCGGEEFIVIARVTTDAHAVALAERLRVAVERLGIVHPDNPASPNVTVSIGATRLGREYLLAGEKSWLARADRALYEAKAAGRNCVRFSAEPVEPSEPTTQ